MMIDQQDMTHAMERMIEKQIGKPVRYDPTTGEFVVINNDDPQQIEEAK